MAAIAATWVLWAGAGCDEISARRAVQEANKEYEKGHFEEAAELYEEALRKAPHLDTAHFNAGLTYKKLFRPGVDTPENMALAKAASDHFATYLEKFPDESKIVDMMTSVWLESGDYQSALNYWERELAKAPKNTEVMGILAGINRQAGDWDKAIEWHRRQIEVESDPLAKAGGYRAIGKLLASRLRDPDSREIVGYERLKIADAGIAALQKAAELDPEDPEAQTSLGFLFVQRALGQGATWAQMIEMASARHHYRKWSALTNKGKPPVPQQGATKGEPAPEQAGDEAGAEGEAEAGAQDEAEAGAQGEAGAKGEETSAQAAKPAGGAAAQQEKKKPAPAKPAAKPAGGAATQQEKKKPAPAPAKPAGGAAAQHEKPAPESAGAQPAEGESSGG